MLCTVFPGPRTTQQKLTKGCKRPWSPEEKKAVNKELGDCIRKFKVPGKLLCTSCLRNQPVLAKRNWTDVKNFVHNTIQSIKKKHVKRS